MVGICHAPRIARVATRGDRSRSPSATSCAPPRRSACPRRRILFGEILPNITSPLLVEFGLRLTYSIGLIAALSFLGFGCSRRPPTGAS